MLGFTPPKSIFIKKMQVWKGLANNGRKSWTILRGDAHECLGLLLANVKLLEINEQLCRVLNPRYQVFE